MLAHGIPLDEVITTDRVKAAVEAIGDPSRARYIKTDVIVEGRAIHWRGARVDNRGPAHVWVTGHSDHGVTAAMADAAPCPTWFCVNKTEMHPKLVGLPCGLTNHTHESVNHQVYGNLEQMAEIMKEEIPISNRVLLNCTATHPERAHVRALFEPQPWVTSQSASSTPDGRAAFLRGIRAHEFVLCPRGNGEDTHRLWETLYMGRIPIVRRTAAADDWDGLPIAWINSWEEVTLEKLDAWKREFCDWTPRADCKLRLSYWVRRIQAAATPRALTLGSALTACDLNDKYLGFWPLVKRAWNEIVGIPVTMILVARESDAPPHLLSDPDVVLFEPVAGWPTATQAQVIRVLWPALMPPDAAVVTTDMDLIPVSRAAMHTGVAAANEHQFVTFNRVLHEHGQVTICFCAASPHVWAQLFRVRSDADVRAWMEHLAGAIQSDGRHGLDGGIGWTTDQELLYRAWVNLPAPQRVELGIEMHNGHRRMCRTREQHWSSNGLPDVGKAVAWIRAHDAVDFHLPSWRTHAEFVHKLIDALTSHT